MSFVVTTFLGQNPNLYFNEVPNRSRKRMLSFCESALHNEVFPVPGGPCKSTTRFQDTKFAM